MLLNKKYILTTIFVLLTSLTGIANANTEASYPAITAVNLGGLFVLEDPLFTSNQIGHEVSTPCTQKTGIASTQIFTGDTSKPALPWTSETDLIYKLKEQYSSDEVIHFFQRHRGIFLGSKHPDPSLKITFDKLEAAGIKLVRIPLPWALQYKKSYTLIGADKKEYTIPAMNKKKGIILIQDPFYQDKQWATLPIAQIEKILVEAEKHHIKVILDLHNFPGGASDGPFNGVWPLAPRFWTANSLYRDNPPETFYQHNFQVIFKQLLNWVTSLEKDNNKAFQAIAGLTPMNEPAHMLGNPDGRCDATTPWGATYTDVLSTLKLAVNDFRYSGLGGGPKKHRKKLYVNVIETMFPQGGDTLGSIGTWWYGITSEYERNTWAVLDIHHYVAWDNQDYNNCLAKDESGKYKFLTKNGMNSYSIKPIEFEKIQATANWYLTLRQKLHLNPRNLLSTSEFSASTNYDTWRSCSSGRARDENNNPINITNYKDYRNEFLKLQLHAAKQAQANIEMIFWTWLLPYNDNFQNEWSAENF